MLLIQGGLVKTITGPDLLKGQILIDDNGKSRRYSGAAW